MITIIKYLRIIRLFKHNNLQLAEGIKLVIQFATVTRLMFHISPKNEYV